jgi:hypothetical protein
MRVGNDWGRTVDLDYVVEEAVGELGLSQGILP